MTAVPRLRALTRRLDRAVDLNDIARGDGMLFVRDGAGLAGRGIALRGSAPLVRQALAAAACDDPVALPGSGIVALGVLPFSTGSSADLVIPRVTVGKDGDGNVWLTTVTNEHDDDTVNRLVDEAFDTSRPAPAAARFSVGPLTPIDRYLAAVSTVRDSVADGTIDKAVVSREIVVTADQPIDIHAVLLRLKASFGSSYRYSFDGFIGASPELLVSRNGHSIVSHPLAGTMPRTGDPAVDREIAEQLIRSLKNQVEHRVVIDVVHDTLLPFCSYLDWEPEPSIVAVANVQHLGTRIEGRLSAGAPDALALAEMLSPTPALGGHPRDLALRLIGEVEERDRGRYGGAVGWLDADGNGTWAVAIRCAQFDAGRTSAVLTAGGGIVAASDPLDELAETQAKFQAMLAAIVRP